jgi:hypothetical protein
MQSQTHPTHLDVKEKYRSGRVQKAATATGISDNKDSDYLNLQGEWPCIKQTAALIAGGDKTM